MSEERERRAQQLREFFGFDRARIRRLETHGRDAELSVNVVLDDGHGLLYFGALAAMLLEAHGEVSGEPV